MKGILRLTSSTKQQLEILQEILKNILNSRQGKHEVQQAANLSTTLKWFQKTGNPVGNGQAEAEPIDNALNKNTTQNLPTMNAQTTPREADEVQNVKRDYSSEPESLNMNS